MIVLFQKPVAFETMKPYSYGGASGGPASAYGLGRLGRRSGPLGTLGDWASDLVGAVSQSVIAAVDTISGQKATREAQQRALQLAQIQAQEKIAQAQASSLTVQKAAPYVAIGLIGLVGLVVFAKRKH
jgi:hypothetical protein